MAEVSADKFVVMVAVDRSKHSEAALDYYVNHIHKPTNAVYLVHVPEGPTTTTAVMKHSNIDVHAWQKLMEKEAKETEELSTKYQDKVEKANIAAVYKTFYGKPGEALCEAATELGANMVIIGTRGLGCVRRTILGSVSDYLIHHVHVPVVVCRQK